MQKRDIAVYIILSLVTCGIYFIVVSYLQLKEMEDKGITLKVPSWAVLLLNIFVSAAGGALLGYAADDGLNQLREQKGLPKEDNMILWIVLGIFFPVITGALVQNSTNKLVDAGK